MKIITNIEAYEYYCTATSELPQNALKSKRSSACAKQFITEHNLPDSEVNITVKFKRLIETKPSSKTSDDSQLAWCKKVFMTVNSKGGRPKKSLGERPCTKRVRSIMSENVLQLEEFAHRENITREDALEMLIGECKRKWKVNKVEKCYLPEIDATALIYNINLSITQYQMLRSICLPYQMVFPVRNQIDVIKKTLHPPILSQEIKSSVDMKALLNETVVALLSLNKAKLIERNSFTVLGKFGVDGSGSHKVRHQLVDADASLLETGHLDHTKTSTFLLSCYVPLEIVDEENKNVWRNPIPNSTSFARPIFLMRAPENREVLEVELEGPLQHIRNPVEEELNVDGLDVKVNFKTECSMIDGKMASLLQGDSGAFCHYCTTTRAEANDINNIQQGFHINKDYNSCREAWEKLERGEIAYSSSERQGQCHESIAKIDLHFFSILHFKLRALDFAQKILYHLVSGQKSWSESGNYVSKFIECAKKSCISHIRQTTGMLIDSPCGSGGNTNTGPLADRYFSPKNRANICELINSEEDRDNYEYLLSLINILLQVTQSVNNSKVVKIDEVKAMGIELMMHIKNSFLDENGNSWIMIIPTIHQLCAHSWEMFQLNQGKSIAMWSENPLESWNKHVRSFQSGPAARARQMSVKTNIYDIFRRMLITSHPIIASKRLRPFCRICGEEGHSARSAKHRRGALPTGNEQMKLADMYYP